MFEAERNRRDGMMRIGEIERMAQRNSLNCGGAKRLNEEFVNHMHQIYVNWNELSTIRRRKLYIECTRERSNNQVSGYRVCLCVCLLVLYIMCTKHQLEYVDLDLVFHMVRMFVLVFAFVWVRKRWNMSIFEVYSIFMLFNIIIIKSITWNRPARGKYSVRKTRRTVRRIIAV